MTEIIPYIAETQIATSEDIVNALAQVERVLDMIGTLGSPQQRFQIATQAKARSKLIIDFAREINSLKSVSQSAVRQWVESKRVRGEALLDMDQADGTVGQFAGRDSSGDYILSSPEDNPTYKELGISPRDAAQEQAAARLRRKDAEKYDTFVSDREESLSLSWGAVYHYAKNTETRDKKIKNINRISLGNAELDIDRTYPIIYADPPWRYEHVKTSSRAIENQYPTMALEDICGLDVPQIASNDCTLFLWATNPKLEEAMQVIEAWGFTYRTNITWVKNQIGMGYYVRGQHELLLIAARGSMPVPETANRPPSYLKSDRLGHSEKPNSFYKLIETMYPEYDKIELFSRNQRQGWDSWGNEA